MTLNTCLNSVNVTLRFYLEARSWKLPLVLHGMQATCAGVEFEIGMFAVG